MESANFNIVIGNTWARTLYFEDESNNPVDITGWTILFTVKTNLTASVATLSISGTIVNATEGEATIELSRTDTTQTAGQYIYEIKVITDELCDAVNETFSVTRGLITFEDTVSTRTT